MGTQTVQLSYDYIGQRVAKVVGSSVTRYYSQLAEVTDSWLTKYYYAGGIMVASQRVAAGQLAMLPDMPAVQVAALPGHVPTLVVLLRGDAQKGLLLAVGLIGTGLLLAPWRRKRVVGIAIRHGHVIGVVFLFTLSSLPLPILFAPATAQAATPTPTPTRTPTPTTTPPGGTGATGVLHYHFDHLGSTEVITKPDITQPDHGILAQIRYKPYGEERYRSVNECNGDNYCREFTQYDTEPISGLEYAGARFYDPTLGQFLTHDPARQFANPYAYGPWDPINGTDPTGAAFGIDDALYWGGIFLLAAGVVAAGVQAGIQTGSPLAGFNAALTSAAMAGVSAVGLNVVMYGVGFAAGVAGQQALSAALVGMGAYNTYQGFKNGDYVSAGLGVVSAAVGAYGLAEGIGAQPARAGVTQGTNQSPLEMDPNGTMCAQRGHIGVEGQVEAYDQAVGYLKTDPDTRTMIESLENGQHGDVTVRTNSSMVTGVKGSEISWDPHMGVVPTTGGFISPGMALGHEFAHVSLPKWIRFLSTYVAFRSDQGTYDTLEDHLIIDRWERGAAARLGETGRFDHRGTAVPSLGVTPY